MRFLSEVHVFMFTQMLTQNSSNRPTPTTPEAPSDLLCLWWVYYWREAGQEIPPHLAASRNHAFKMSFSLCCNCSLEKGCKVVRRAFTSLAVWLYFGNQFRSRGWAFPSPLEWKHTYVKGKKSHSHWLFWCCWETKHAVASLQMGSKEEIYFK